jgi:hypothetical protein
VPLKIQINFDKKTRFWKENSVQDVVTIGLMAEATLIYMKVELSLNRGAIGNVLRNALGT